MGRMNLGIDDTIIFKEDTHQYFDKTGIEYSSVTRTLNKIKVPFDRDGISKMMARSLSKEKGITIDKAQEIILSEWDAKRDSSIDRGNSIHGSIEHYLLTGKTTDEYYKPISFVSGLIRNYYRFYPEIILYHQDFLIAGQADLVCQRQKSANSVYDFYDYKTNEAKGIQFDSIGRKTDDLKHYNRFFLPPLDFMEDCNYNLYALQLSMYAFFAEMTYGIKVGRLGIIFISNDMDTHMIPVPYLRYHVQRVLEFMMEVKPLPKEKSVVTTKDEDDW